MDKVVQSNGIFVWFFSILMNKLPNYDLIFGLIGKAGYQYEMWYGTSKIIVNKMNISTESIQCPPLCL